MLPVPKNPFRNLVMQFKKIRDSKSDRAALLKGLRVGLPAEYFSDALDSDVREQVEDAIEQLRKAGAEIKKVALPASKYALAVYYVVAVSEASANLARYDGVRFGLREMPKGADSTLDEMYAYTRGAGFGPEVKRRILLGTFALSAGYYEAYFKKACQVRNLISQEFQKAFEQCDILLGPTTPTVAFKGGEKTMDPLKMYLNDIYTVPVNLAGLPGVSMPWGTGADGMPVGVQLIGPAFSEQKLLEVAATMEFCYDESR